MSTERKIKLDVLSLVYNNEMIIDMMLESAVHLGDKVLLLDGGSTDHTISIIKQFQEKYPDKIILYDGLKECPEAYKKQLKDEYGRVLQNGHFGMMKTFLSKKSEGEWIFWLDTDECVNDNAREMIEKIISADPDTEGYNIEYVHFIHDFYHVDNSEKIHSGLLRLYRNIPEIQFSMYNHTLPEYRWTRVRLVHSLPLKIFHLGYARNLLDVWIRYKRNILFSEIHKKVDQYFWRDWHYFKYPVLEQKYNPQELPKAIKKRFDIGVYE